jgi:pimeloyl-ACP methyl ester carboxylesterase
MGGSWNDYESNYFHTYSLRPLDRQLDNVFRTMSQQDEIDNQLAAPVSLLADSPRIFRDPVSDAYFEGMLSQLVPSQEAPFNITREVLEDSDERRIEEVVIEYPTGSPFTLYLALPKPLPDSAQSVIYMPHGGAFMVGKTPNRYALQHFDEGLNFIYRSGRVAIVPIWTGSRERYRSHNDNQHLAAAAWYDDVRRTIDFIDQDPTMDGSRIALMGFSYGALFGPVLLGIEARLATGILISGGIYSVSDIHPSLDVINYAPRIRQPVLMVNGRFDPIVPYGSSQERLLELLPNEANRQVLFDELGHYGFPRHRFYRAVTDWLDEQLGPVR